jgi:hypothetical protein
VVSINEEKQSSQQGADNSYLRLIHKNKNEGRPIGDESYMDHTQHHLIQFLVCRLLFQNGKNITVAYMLVLSKVPCIYPLEITPTGDYLLPNSVSVIDNAAYYIPTSNPREKGIMVERDGNSLLKKLMSKPDLHLFN